MTALLGMLTGIGGGMARDVLLREIPMVLRAELYAVAALAGASIVVIGEASALTEPSGILVPDLSLSIWSLVSGSPLLATPF